MPVRQLKRGKTTKEWELQLPSGIFVDIVSYYGEDSPIRCDFWGCAYKTDSIRAFFIHILTEHFGIGPARAARYWNERLNESPAPVTVWEVQQDGLQNTATYGSPKSQREAFLNPHAIPHSISPQNGSLPNMPLPSRLVPHQNFEPIPAHSQYRGQGMPIISDYLNKKGPMYVATSQPSVPYPIVAQQVLQPNGQYAYQVIPMAHPQYYAAPQFIAYNPVMVHPLSRLPQALECQRPTTATIVKSKEEPGEPGKPQKPQEASQATQGELPQPHSIPLPVRPLSSKGEEQLAGDSRMSQTESAGCEVDNDDSQDSRCNIILRNPGLKHQSHARIKGVVRCGQHCGYELPSYWEMARHLDVEHQRNYRPWRCSSENCIWSVLGFHKSSMLSRHMVTAHSARHSDCRICGRSFQRKDGLLRHMRKRHSTSSLEASL